MVRENHLVALGRNCDGLSRCVPSLVEILTLKVTGWALGRSRARLGLPSAARDACEGVSALSRAA